MIGEVINFQAPDEGTGTDAKLQLEQRLFQKEISRGNATKLPFKTAASEAASEKDEFRWR